MVKWRERERERAREREREIQCSLQLIKMIKKLQNIESTEPVLCYNSTCYGVMFRARIKYVNCHFESRLGS